MSTATIADRTVETKGESNRLTEVLQERLSHPATSPDFDLKKGVNEVLADVGMTSDDCGGALSFYGSDPILQSPLRFGTMAAVGLAARTRRRIAHSSIGFSRVPMYSLPISGQDF